MDHEIIVTTKAELRQIIAEECNRLYSRLAKGKGSEVESDTLPIDKAVEFLATQGYAISKHTLYTYVNNEEVPYAKFNGKLVFSRRDLLRWAESRKEKHIPSRQRQAEILAKSATKKRKVS